MLGEVPCPESPYCQTVPQVSVLRAVPCEKVGQCKCHSLGQNASPWKEPCLEEKAERASQQCLSCVYYVAKAQLCKVQNTEVVESASSPCI